MNMLIFENFIKFEFFEILLDLSGPRRDSRGAGLGTPNGGHRRPAVAGGGWSPFLPTWAVGGDKPWLGFSNPNRAVYGP